VAGSENSLTFMTRRVKYIRGIYFLAEQLGYVGAISVTGLFSSS
jgi:hypothetical protein